jgi:hypothetical protein
MTDPKKRKWRIAILVSLAVVAGILLAGWFFVLPKLTGGGHTKDSLIEDNLKQIYSAKQMWAEDQGIANGVQVTETDLIPYCGKIKAVDDEQYSINPIGTPPEAKLTRAMKPWPQGTIMRLLADGKGRDIILPGSAGAPNPASPSAKATNGTSALPAR